MAVVKVPEFRIIDTDSNKFILNEALSEGPNEGYMVAYFYEVNLNPSSFQFTYNTFSDIKLKKTHSEDSQMLPTPATYIINQDGIIIASI